MSKSVFVAVMFSMALLLGSVVSGFAGDCELYFYTEDSPPANYVEDGQLKGGSVDILRELVNRAECTANFAIVPWARGYKLAQEVPNSGVFSTIRSEARDPLFEWVGPLLRFSWGFFAKKDSPLVITTLDEAKGVRLIGGNRNDAKTQFLLDRDFKNIDVADNLRATMRKLDAGRIEMIVSSEIAIVEYASMAGVDATSLKNVFTVKSSDMYLAMSRGTDPAIIDRLQKAYTSMRQDGTFEKIFTAAYPGLTMPPAPQSEQ